MFWKIMYISQFFKYAHILLLEIVGLWNNPVRWLHQAGGWRVLLGLWSTVIAVQILFWWHQRCWSRMKTWTPGFLFMGVYILARQLWCRYWHDHHALLMTQAGAVNICYEASACWRKSSSFRIQTEEGKQKVTILHSGLMGSGTVRLNLIHGFIGIRLWLDNV